MERGDSDGISSAVFASAGTIAAVGAAAFLLWRVNAPVLEPDPWE